jgi:hypothetical protein
LFINYKCRKEEKKEKEKFLSSPFFPLYMSTIYKPTKRIYSVTDPFFQEGNILLRAYWLKKQVQSKQEIEWIQQETNSILSV